VTTGIAWRLAKAEDVPAINALTARSVRTRHVGWYAEAVIDEAVDHAYGVDWQLIIDGTYFVAEIAGEMAGAGGWSFRQTIAGAHGPDRPEPAPLDPARNAARVRAFYVDPLFHRRGVGAFLLGLSESAARRAGFRDCELTSTLPAAAFYAAQGYERVRGFDLALPSGALLELQLMRKSLGRGSLTRAGH
jgi:GNAT superfamily N-acetyltransferase